MSNITKIAALLAVGETILESARQLPGGKVQIAIATRLQGGSLNIASLLNKSDARFASGSGIRRAWQAGEKNDIEAMFGIKLDANLSTDKMNPTMINLLSPSILGQAINLQIEEKTATEIKALRDASTSASVKNSYQWTLDNENTTAKRAGKDGDFLMKNGDKIFSLTEIVAGTPEHSFIKHDPKQEEVALEAPMASAMATPEN
jgi:hypothetical protein